MKPSIFSSFALSVLDNSKRLNKKILIYPMAVVYHLQLLTSYYYLNCKILDYDIIIIFPYCYIEIQRKTQPQVNLRFTLT